MKNPKGQQYATSRPAVCNLTGNKGTIQVISSDFDKKENLRKENYQAWRFSGSSFPYE